MYKDMSILISFWLHVTTLMPSAYHHRITTQKNLCILKRDKKWLWIRYRMRGTDRRLQFAVIIQMNKNFRSANMKNVAAFLLFCGIVTIHPAPLQSPFFGIEDGVLVPYGKNASNVNSYSRIVGGENSEHGSAPWMVSLQWSTVRPAHFCGGSIINPNWVLTAGHCIQGFPRFGVSTVVAGLHDLDEFSDAQQIRHVTHRNTWVHEDYDGYVGPHDIGLLVFQTPFTFNALVSAIALPEPDQIPFGIASLHGWGSVSYTVYPSYPTVLQWANMPIILLQTCRASWNYNPDPIHDTHVCAGSLDGGVGACSMDIGGALVQNGVAVGIFSWGTIPCGIALRPSVYVRVSAYRSWIQDTIDDFAATQ